MDGDILDQLTGDSSASALNFAREIRQGVTLHAQTAFETLLLEQRQAPSQALRLVLAAQVAQLNGCDELVDFYRSLKNQAQPTESSLQQYQAGRYVRLMALSPVEASAADLDALKHVGFTTAQIVTIAQLAGFVSFQSRLLMGMHLLQGKGRTGPSEPPVAGHWKQNATTLRGSPAATDFTRDTLTWEPWLTALCWDQISADDQQRLRHHGQASSEYFRLLAHNMPVLEQRTQIDRGIFYTPGGLPRAERELAATVTSRVNGCIYCASVHARKSIQFFRDPEPVERLLKVSAGGMLSAQQTPRMAAIIDFAGAHSATPSLASLADIQRLQDAGLDTLELLDVVQSTAFFAWANRLMQTLGEPALNAA